MTAAANVAAVSYHFGSLQSLCDAAVEQALELYLDTQQEAVSELGPESTLGEAAAAFARPMINAMAVGGRDLVVMRILARSRDRSSSGLGSAQRQVRSDSCRRSAGGEGEPS